MLVAGRRGIPCESEEIAAWRGGDDATDANAERASSRDSVHGVRRREESTLAFHNVARLKEYFLTSVGGEGSGLALVACLEFSRG
jgi:hypothetical protein